MRDRLTTGYSGRTAPAAKLEGYSSFDAFPLPNEREKLYFQCLEEWSDLVNLTKK